MNSKSTDYKVIVVGAGIAGLSAAQHLVKNGVASVVVVEAQNRIGGRIHTVTYGSGNIELGANWIHGTNQANSIFNLANQYRLIETPLNIHDRSKGAIIHSGGLAIDQSLSFEIFNRIKDIEYQTTKLKHEPNGQTLKEFCEDRIQEMLNKYPEEEHKIINSVYNYFKNYMSLHAGDAIEEVSAWGYGAYNEIPNDIVVKGGFVRLIDRIVDEIGREKILLNHEVIQIDWNSKPVRIQVKANSKDIQTFTTNYVVITTSIGVLKVNHKQLFVPNLPQNKTDAIERMGFGKVGKIFLYYSTPFWTPGTLENLKFARDDDHSEQQWTERINGFEEALDNPNVIQAWISGQQTIDLELTDDKEVIEKCTQLLRQFCGDPSIPKADSVLKTEWVTNPYIRGSYSYPTTRTLSNDYKLIAEPLPNLSEPVILFAGEATHECYFSTVHGARLTGLTQAEHIIHDINKFA